MYSSQRRGPLQTVETPVGRLVGAAVGRAVASGLLVAPTGATEGVGEAEAAETEADAEGADTDDDELGTEVGSLERSALLGVTWIGAWPCVSRAGSEADSGAASAEDELDFDCESITVTPAAMPSAAITASTPISLLRCALPRSDWAMV